MAPIKTDKTSRAKMAAEQPTADVAPIAEQPVLPVGTALPSAAEVLPTTPETKVDETQRAADTKTAEGLADPVKVRPSWAATVEQLAGFEENLMGLIGTFYGQRPVIADMPDWAAPTDDQTMARVQAWMVANPGQGLFAAMGAVTAQIAADKKAHEQAKADARPVDAAWLKDIATILDKAHETVNAARRALGVRNSTAGSTSDRAASNPSAATKTPSRNADRNQAWIKKATEVGALNDAGQLIITTQSDDGYKKQGRRFLVVNPDGTFTHDGVNYVNWQQAFGVEGQVAPRAMLCVWIGDKVIVKGDKTLNATTKNGESEVVKPWIHFDTLSF